MKQVYKCNVEGCEEETYKRGFCKQHYFTKYSGSLTSVPQKANITKVCKVIDCENIVPNNRCTLCADCRRKMKKSNIRGLDNVITDYTTNLDYE